MNVGLTEQHGMAVELSQTPPDGVTYTFPAAAGPAPALISSPIKGFLARFDAGGNDLLEAVISPIITDAPWIYCVAGLQQAVAFGLLNVPLPRIARTTYIKRLLLRDNFKGLVFRSEAGKRTLATYGHIDDPRLLAKVAVVHPGVRAVPDDLVRFQDREIVMLFTGDFFLKGGVNVVDAFELAQQRYPSVRLRLCCNDSSDFYTPNTSLRQRYLDKIRTNRGIELLGRVPRARLLTELLPASDIFLMPTYVDTFGFAILEAMAYGLPIIATNHFAIPEMIEHERSGLLVDIERYDSARIFVGQVVRHIPADFQEHVTAQTFEYMCQLVDSLERRKALGLAALHTARTKFSVDRRNERMLEIYRRAAS
jgi:glycosyltransferase involved in cell wall biosynthesis